MLLLFLWLGKFYSSKRQEEVIQLKKLIDKVYELRISGTVAVRILYTIFSNEFYLLHAFKKKTQKTPTKEIKTALDRMKEII